MGWCMCGSACPCEPWRVTVWWRGREWCARGLPALAALVGRVCVLLRLLSHGAVGRGGGCECVPACGGLVGRRLPAWTSACWMGVCRLRLWPLAVDRPPPLHHLFGWGWRVAWAARAFWEGVVRVLGGLFWGSFLPGGSGWCSGRHVLANMPCPPGLPVGGPGLPPLALRTWRPRPGGARRCFWVRPLGGGVPWRAVGSGARDEPGSRPWLSGRLACGTMPVLRCGAGSGGLLACPLARLWWAGVRAPGLGRAAGLV